MAYTTNPHQPKVRRDAVRKVKIEHWSIRKTSRYFGVSPSTVSRWVKKDVSGGRYEIPTKSSRPKTSPNALHKEVVEKIIQKRIERRRCGQVIHQELLREGVKVSLPSVQRTLERANLLKKRSPWKRPHDPTERPEVTHSGALVQVDTVHFRLPNGEKLYVYTLIDLFSRWAYAEATEKINTYSSIRFLDNARGRSDFLFEMVQTDHGPEFSKYFTHAMWRRGLSHRHSRVRQSNDNAHVERFNRTVQEECLDKTTHSILAFRKALKEYLAYYNNERLHMGIDYQTPEEVLRRS